MPSPPPRLVAKPRGDDGAQTPALPRPTQEAEAAPLRAESRSDDGAQTPALLWPMLEARAAPLPAKPGSDDGANTPATASPCRDDGVQTPALPRPPQQDAGAAPLPNKPCSDNGANTPATASPCSDNDVQTPAFPRPPQGSRAAPLPAKLPRPPQEARAARPLPSLPIVASGPRWQGSAVAALFQKSDVSALVRPRRNDVQLHIYHCDKVTGFLNETVLLKAEIPIYHVGVEVFGREWMFQCFEDAWDDSSITGVRSCPPKGASGFHYVRTVNLGPTRCSEPETLVTIGAMMKEWPACSYHITRRNCVTFAEELAASLGVTTQFPPWLRAILDASSRNVAADAIVNYTWALSKWWMKRGSGDCASPARAAPRSRWPSGCFRMADCLAGCAPPGSYEESV